MQNCLKNLLLVLLASKKFLLASLADFSAKHAGVHASRAQGTLRVPRPLKAAVSPGGVQDALLGIEKGHSMVELQTPA